MVRKNAIVLLLVVTITLLSTAFAAPKNDAAQGGATTQGFMYNK